MVYEFVVAMKDLVTPAAKTAGVSLQGLSSALVQAKNAGGESLSALANGFRSLASGNFPDTFRAIGHGVTDMLHGLDAVVPGLGTVLSTVGGVVFSLGGAFLDLAHKGMSMALSFGETKRQTLAMYDALGSGVSTGTDITAMIGALGAKLHMTGGYFKPWAKELLAMGHTTLPDLRRELVAAASAQALMGESAGTAYVGIVDRINVAKDAMGKMKLDARLERQLKGVGVSLVDIARELGTTEAKLKGGSIAADQFGDALRTAVTKKGKGPLEAFGSSLEGIGNDFSRFWKSAFAAVDTKPLLNALRDMVSGLGGSKDATSGLTSALNAFFQFAAKAIPWVVFAIWDVVDSVLELAVAFKTGGSTGSAALDMIVASVKAIGTVIDVVKVSVEMLGKALEPIVWAFEKLGALSKLPDLFSGDEGKIAKALDVPGPTVAMPDQQAIAVAAGKSFTDGVASGIRDGEGDVALATTELGKRMRESLQRVLDAHSPSRVSMALGVNVSEGFALGIRQQTPEATIAGAELGRDAVTSVREYGSPSFTQPVFAQSGTPSGSDAGRATPSSSSSTTVQAGPFYISIDGAGKTALEITEEMISTVFERLALSQGGG